MPIDPLTITAGASVANQLFSKGPKQYSPRGLANLDEEFGRRRLRDSLMAEQYGEQNPYYNTQWTGTPGGADRQRVTTLNAADQQNLDSRRGVDSRLLAMVLGGQQQG